MNVSIVIRALNEAEHLPRLLEGIAAQNRVADEVILVDSGSTDGTVAIAERAGCKVVHIPPSDFSFGRALNVGCEAAKGDVLVFASAHTYPLDSDWLGNLVEPFGENRVALSYGSQRGDSRSTFSETQLLRGWFPEQNDLDQDNPFCNNANCAVRRDIWQRIPYDEELPGLEDIAWAKRAIAEGWQLVYRADAGIAHIHEERFKQTVRRYRREAIAYSHVEPRARLGGSEALRLALTSIVADFRSLAGSERRRQLSTESRSIISFRCAQFWGAWSGGRSADIPTDRVIKKMYYEAS